MTVIYLTVFAQVLLALYYVIGAINDIQLWQQGLELMGIKKIPSPKFFYASAAALKFAAGIALGLNIFASIAALFLAIFTLIANCIFNNFWRDPAGLKRQFALNRFLCNLAVIGGLLLVIVIHA